MSNALEVARNNVPAMDLKWLMTVLPFRQDFFCLRKTTPCGV